MKFRIGLNAFQRLLACAAAVAAFSWTTPASALDAPVRIVVPFNAGGSLDTLARLLAPKLAKGLQQTVVVENRVGAGGLVGAEHVVRADPDGRTLLLGSTFLATTNGTAQARFNPATDLLPVIQVNSTEILLVVHDALEVQSLPELQRLAQRKPGGLNCGAAPGIMALGCDRLAVALGGASVSVPYAGVAPTLNALMAGHVDIAFLDRASLGAAQAGQRVRVLASAGQVPGRAPFEHLPLLKSTWPSLSISGFGGIFVPAHTPTGLISKLNLELNTALADPEVRAAASRVGENLVGGSPDTLAKTLAAATANYAQEATPGAAKPGSK